MCRAVGGALNRRLALLQLGLIGSGCARSAKVSLGNTNVELEDYVLDALSPRLEIEFGEKTGYDAVHYLMVPLHAGYTLDLPRLRRKLTVLVEHYLDQPVADRPSLTRFHLLYFLSRWYALQEQFVGNGALTLRVARYLSKALTDIWLNQPSWHWSPEAPFRGLKERFQWRRTLRANGKSYYRAILDEDLFFFASVADLAGRVSDLPVEALESAKSVFTDDVVVDDKGRWVLQPGIWHDHPSQRLSKSAFGQTCGSWDSSHSHRLPLWLRSLERIDPNFYRIRRDGLRRMFFEQVLQPGPIPRLTNYMDGCNGRYDESRSDFPGYGPYELSGSLLLGWWGFLGGDAIRQLYSQLQHLLTDPGPNREVALQLYAGPARDMRKIVDSEAVNRDFRSRKGLIALICAHGCEWSATAMQQTSNRVQL